MSLEKQRTTWDEKERLCAVRLVIEQYDVLYGGFADGITFKEKSAAWNKVADDLNASSNVKRTPAEVKKLFQNVKSRAKKKYNENMATGGGPVGKITLAEEIVLEFLKDKPQLIGIPGGIESGVIEPVEDAASVADLVVQQAPMTESKHISTHQETVSVHAIEHPSVSHEHPDEPRVMQTNTKKRRRKCMDRIELTEELHDLEVCRARKEIELLDLKIAQQRELFQLKKSVLENAMRNANMDFNITFPGLGNESYNFS
ncbi:uncharacterized protein LOC128242473 [Mya arenaria]|nr:uncharacterized protein LOC128203445 [Mya arenaria]XP_052804353.1 uncharacterized protein LOC128234264 [Mya arenaria]XP_052813232.1 uncharacterized protein LOC128240581 [Mya arenaria]XP_052815589.1 uncharacterized protein LOC128242473 [Mya arenaria]